MPTKERYEAWLKAGRCGSCGRHREDTHKAACHRCSKAASKWRQEFRDKGCCPYCRKPWESEAHKACLSDQKERTKARKAAGLCYRCGKHLVTSDKPRCAACDEKERSIKRQVMDAYGGKCSCCSETTLEFLCIDHIDGGGNAHRKEIGLKIYRWLIKHRFPRGFQVLCANCNLGKQILGECPHRMSAPPRQVASKTGP